MASLRERLMGRAQAQPKPGANGKPGDAPAQTPAGGTPIPPNAPRRAATRNSHETIRRLTYREMRR